MNPEAMYVITVTGTENREWQGSVHFPDVGEDRSFNSLLELIRLVECHGAPAGQWECGTEE